MVLGAFRGGNPLERIVAISDKWSGKLPRNRLRGHVLPHEFPNSVMYQNATSGQSRRTVPRGAERDGESARNSCAYTPRWEKEGASAGISGGCVSLGQALTEFDSPAPETTST